MRNMVIAAAVTAAITAGGLVSAPAALADTTRDELLAAAAATQSANADGYANTVESALFDSYTTSAVGTGLGTANPRVTAQWNSDDSGVFTAVVASGDGSARKYMSFGHWKGFWADGAKNVLAAVGKAVRNEGGADDSLLVDREFSAAEWADAASIYLWETGRTVQASLDSLPADTVITKTPYEGGATFSFAVGNNTMNVKVTAAGLIESYSLLSESGLVEYSVTTTARGTDVQQPNLEVLTLSTDVLLRAERYMADRTELAIAVIRVTATAETLAKSQGSRVTSKILARAVKTTALEPSVKAVTAARGVTLEARNNSNYADFGKLCATLSPGKSKPRVSYCAAMKTR